jgi:hypothetical protein
MGLKAVTQEVAMFKTLPAREDQERSAPSPPHAPFRTRFEEEVEEGEPGNSEGATEGR